MKAWLVSSKDFGTYLTHEDDDVPYEGSADTVIQSGRFLTDSDLESFAKQCFEAGRSQVCGEWEYMDFKSFWREENGVE